jgi:hypothetical protein
MWRIRQAGQVTGSVFLLKIERMKRIVLLTAALLLAAGTGFAQDEEGLALLKFVVLRDYNGKPIRNASVVLHPVNKKGKQERGGLQVKADAEGKCNYDGVPYGKLRIQVLAPGFQTFGQDYEINQPEQEIVVRMKRPQEQYSIYTDKQNDKKDGAPPPEKKDAGGAEKPKSQ